MNYTINTLIAISITIDSEILKLSNDNTISDRVFDILRKAALKQQDVIDLLSEARAWNISEQGDSHSP